MKKLRFKFIVLSMTALFILLAIIVTGMNIINYRSVVKESDGILSLLSKNKGTFPQFNGDKGGKLPPNMSPELPFESRFFSVLLSKNGQVIRTETSKIAGITPDTAIKYASKVSDDKGFINNYRYIRTTENRAVRITFLDCGRRLDFFKTFLVTSITIAFCGYIIVFFVLFFFAGKIIKPIADSYEKQKQFITDAGHEIKTPLTIINANIDLLEMEIGENNECLEDIQIQTQRLAKLTSELVMLARMEEQNELTKSIDFPASDIISDIVMSFKAVAETGDKKLEYNIQPMISMRGDSNLFEKLVSIIVDNAFKYSPIGDTIRLSFTKQARFIELTITNHTTTTLSQKELGYIFDRFYRTDKSRNSETGGHGIGLSLAKAIVTAHGGRISAWTKDNTFVISAVFPI